MRNKRMLRHSALLLIGITSFIAGIIYQESPDCNKLSQDECAIYEHCEGVYETEVGCAGSFGFCGVTRIYQGCTKK